MDARLIKAAGGRADLIRKGKTMLAAGYQVDTVLATIRRDAGIRGACVDEDRYERGIRKIRIGRYQHA